MVQLITTPCSQKNIALSAGEVFIIGVAYHGRDGDDFYSNGEGHSGVTIGVTIATIDGSGRLSNRIAPKDTAAVTVDVAGLTVVPWTWKSITAIKLDLVTGTNGLMALHTSVDSTLTDGISTATFLGVGDQVLTRYNGANHLKGNNGDNQISGLGRATP